MGELITADDDDDDDDDDEAGAAVAPRHDWKAAWSRSSARGRESIASGALPLFSLSLSTLLDLDDLDDLEDAVERFPSLEEICCFACFTQYKASDK